MTIRRAFILAAGFGTRLRPLSERLPKPAWPLFNLPIGVHLMKSLSGAGVDDFIINLHHLKDVMAASMEAGSPKGARLRFSAEEPKILGTGGALKHWAGEFSAQPFFLANADTYRGFDPAKMADFHFEKNADATLSLTPLPPGARGPIEVDPGGRIIRFLDAFSISGGVSAGSYGFTGMHVLGAKVLEIVDEVGKDREEFCINADVHRKLLARGGRLYGYLPPVGGYWSDLGTPGSYLDTHFQMLEKAIVPGYCPGRVVSRDSPTPEGGQIIAPVFLGRGARVEKGAVAGPFAILGEDSVVESGARLSHSVLWAGGRVSGSVDRAIVSADGETMSG